MKSIIQRIRYKLKELYNRSLSDLEYARKVGVRFGQSCILTSRNWGSEPYLIELGDHVHVTHGVHFVTHDGGVWVHRINHPDFDIFGKIKVGNNVYIGNNATILPGVTIGDNCVVGASSVVSKSIPPNSVVAGNPVRFICTTEEYFRKTSINNLGIKGLTYYQKKNRLLSDSPELAEKLLRKQEIKII